MQTMEKRESVIHVLNTFLVNPINIYISRETEKETEKYIIGYEPKRYRIHYLQYKIDKTLTPNIKFKMENKVEINRAVDINIIKKLREISDKWELNVKNVITEIIPTKYGNLPQLYGEIYQFNWRKTNAGGADKMEFTIPECPVIVNSNTISNVCYKFISKQISGSGTHQLHTYLILAPSKGQYVIGNHIRISNINNSGHRNMHIYPVIISL
jgi:hypothetical protein